MKQAYITIHHALHSEQCVVSVDGVDYPVMTAPNGLRYVIYHKVRVIQQDPRKNSTYAERARHGEQISWIIEHPAWICIDAEVINSFSQKQGDQPKTTEDVPG